MARIIRTAHPSNHVPKGFPVLVDDEMRIIEPVFDYLLEIATLRGRTASPVTVQTYADELLDWFDSLEQNGIDWLLAKNQTLKSYRRRHLEAPSPVTGGEYAASTIDARVRSVCRFYKWAAETGRIDETPFPTESYRNVRAGSGFFAHTRTRGKTSERSPLTLNRRRARRRGLSAEEVRRLMKASAEPYRTIIAWAVGTGMRRMELCALSTKQIPNAMALRERDGQLIKIRLTVHEGESPKKGLRAASAHRPDAAVHRRREG